MANQIVPAQVLLAVQELYEDLPELIGEQQWLAAKPAVDEWMARLAESAATLHGLDDSMELVACLSSYPNVREHLRSELSGQQVRAALGDNASSVERATLDFFRYEEGSEETVRRVVLNANGTGGGASRKPGNLRLDVRRLLDLFTDTATGAIGALFASHQLAIVGGVLGVIRGINKAITVELTEKDARVFCALIESHADRAAVSEKSLLEIANVGRKALGLAELSAEELRASLYSLEQIQCVSRIPEMPDHWFIIESYRIRGDAAAR